MIEGTARIAPMLASARNRLARVRHAIGGGRQTGPWHADLSSYFGVSAEQALQLGTRSKGRRPDLPGSSTTHAVNGQTLEEIWEARPRASAREIQSFYDEIGAWAAFRQAVYHRDREFDFVARWIEPGMAVCEYGSGIAPAAWWLVNRFPRRRMRLTLVDVPSEHLRFGQWRLTRRIAELAAPVEVDVRKVDGDYLPLDESYEVVTMLEVYEHLHNPLEVTLHIREHLRSGGIYIENYIRTEPSAADLPLAQQARDSVFAALREHFELLDGRAPEEPDGGGTRTWRRR